MNESFFAKIEESPYVYHYTSMEALFSILEGYRLVKYTGLLPFRASCIYNVNDPREMELGFDAVEKSLSQYENNNQNNMNLSEVYKDSSFKEYYIDSYNEKPNDGMIQFGIVPYIISFSCIRDFLPMWSMYGNKCKGVCLKFNIISIMDKPVECTQYDLVSYDGDMDYNIIEEHLSLLYDLDVKRKRTMTIDEKKEMVFNYCLCISPFIKSKDWSYEKEFRIVYNQNYALNIDYDHLKDYTLHGIEKKSIQKYVYIPINACAIEEIIIGSLADFNVMEHIIRQELKECLMNRVKISRSSIAIT